MSLKREFAIYSYVTILNDLAGVARYLLCFGDAQAHLFHKIRVNRQKVGLMTACRWLGSGSDPYES
nr:hypothetical protein [Gleimia europaea]